MIEFADTSSDPETMVVEFGDTSLALRAMPCSVILLGVADLAKVFWREGLGF